MIIIDTINQYRVLEHIRMFYVMELIQAEVYDDNSLRVTDEDGQEVIFRWNGREVMIE